MHHIRFPSGLTARIDNWIAEQPEPKPSRSEAIRRLVERALAAPGAQTPTPASDASLDRQIAEKENLLANIPEHPKPSPEAALATMDKAMAKNELVKLKNARARRKGAKQS